MAEQVSSNGAPGGGELQPYITPDHYTHLRNFQASFSEKNGSKALV